MLGQITPTQSSMLSPVQPGSFLSNLWPSISNWFVYGTEGKSIFSGGDTGATYPTPPMPVSPPAPAIDAQVPGTSVYIDPTTGQPYTPEQMSTDWWSAVQAQLASYLNNAGSPPDDGSVSWIWWVVGGALVFYSFSGIFDSNLRHGR